jgi:hypothetical protein
MGADAPPLPHHLASSIDITVEQQILDLPQRIRIAEITHHRQADYFWRQCPLSSE